VKCRSPPISIVLMRSRPRGLDIATSSWLVVGCLPTTADAAAADDDDIFGSDRQKYRHGSVLLWSVRVSITTVSHAR